MNRIVKFSNGKFGVQTKRYPKKFADLREDKKFNWKRSSLYFNDCQGTLKECRDYIFEYINEKTKIWKHLKS
jgi:hypothetical protein